MHITRVARQTMSEILSPPLSLSLKRKRPPGLEIPNVVSEIGGDVAENNTNSSSSSYSVPGSVGVLSVKGKKRFMEDTYKLLVSSSSSSSASNNIKGFFGVYDGHGGRKAADFVAENLHTNIFEMIKKRMGDETKEEAVQAGYLKTDNDFLKQGVSSGACCVTAIIKGDEIVISNLGDCRAVLCRGGVAEAVTTDHRAGNDDEQKRIENKGGYVEMHRGAWRVHGVLSVSRSIGDSHLKEWVVAEPDTKTLHLSQDMECLILASDGLWEKVENQEAADIVMGSSQNQKKAEPTKHVENVVKFTLGPNLSPKSKLQRPPLIEKNRKMCLSPLRRKIIRSKEIGDEFPSENEGPPLHKIIRKKEIENEFPSENESPPLRKIIRRKEIEDEFPSKNEGPPLKTRRVSVLYQDQENSDGNMLVSGSCVLVSACNELVNLALSRGSLDDITVMIIDLNHFK